MRNSLKRMKHQNKPYGRDNSGTAVEKIAQRKRSKEFRNEQLNATAFIDYNLKKDIKCIDGEDPHILGLRLPMHSFLGGGCENCRIQFEKYYEANKVLKGLVDG